MKTFDNGNENGVVRVLTLMGLFSTRFVFADDSQLGMNTKHIIL